MAKSLTVFLTRAQVPARNDLQNAIKDLRFRLALDDAYAPFDRSGYVPCTLDGEDAGIDIRFADSRAQLSDQPALQEQAGDHAVAMLLRAGGDPREETSMLILAAVLAARFDGLVLRPGGDTFVSAEPLSQEARSAFAALAE